MKRALALAFVFAAWAAYSDAEECAAEIGAICAGGAPLSEAALIERMRAADVVILGERHDNPAHHEWQARMVAALAPGGLAFEMVPRAKEDVANAARDVGDDLAEALNWADSGWPDWAMYEPIFAAAPDAWIAGGGVGRDALRKAVAEGAAAAFPDGADRYGLSERLAEDVVADMLEEQRIAHCDALPTAMLPGMVEAQQLRDAAFADAALRLHDAERRPVVLITGNGHARRDRGVPFYLGRAAPGLSVFVVGQVELGPEGGRDPGLYDAALFTPPHDRGDPCDAFKKRHGDG